MSNTIRRARRRPRDESIAWRAFPWVLSREVVYQCWQYLATGSAEYLHPREWFCDERNYRRAHRALLLYLSMRATPLILPRV